MWASQVIAQASVRAPDAMLQRSDVLLLGLVLMVICAGCGLRAVVSAPPRLGPALGGGLIGWASPRSEPLASASLPGAGGRPGLPASPCPAGGIVLSGSP